MTSSSISRRSSPARPASPQRSPRRASRVWPVIAVSAVCGLGAATMMAFSQNPATAKRPFVYARWRQFTTDNGLPSDRVLALRVSGNNVWLGTDQGLAVIDKRSGTVAGVWREKDGLPWPVVSAIDVDAETGDVWIGLLGGGLARLSGGRFDHWHQLNSGLASDAVYGVAASTNGVWTATQAGVSGLDTRTGSWTVLDGTAGSPEAAWSSAIAKRSGEPRILFGVWGGVLDLDPSDVRGTTTKPLEAMIVTRISEGPGMVWAATLCGAWRFADGSSRRVLASDGGLPSDAVRSVRARSAVETWFGTDAGLGVLVDSENATWVQYVREGNRGKAIVKQHGNSGSRFGVVDTLSTESGIPDDFINDVDVDATDVWVATGKGVGWGIGDGYYPGLADQATADSEPASTGKCDTNGASAVPLRVSYRGPLRAVPEPDAIDSVKVGFIGPILTAASSSAERRREEQTLGKPMLNGARLAVEQANARGGYRKRSIPFALVASNDGGLWGTAGHAFLKLALQDGVWGIVGAMGGNNSYSVTRMADLAEVVFLNAGDTDPAYDESLVPWALRCIANDREQARVLVDFLCTDRGFRRLGIIHADDRYGRSGLREVQAASRYHEGVVTIVAKYPAGRSDFAAELAALKTAAVDVVIHWGDAVHGARILDQMRKAGMPQVFAASERCLTPEFVALTGNNAAGVVCVSSWSPKHADRELKAFRTAYRERFGQDPGTYAAHAFDGMKMLLSAIEAGGLNRANIHDALVQQTIWHGVTGNLSFASHLDDAGTVFLARRDKGDWTFFSLPSRKARQSSAPKREGGARRDLARSDRN